MKEAIYNLNGMLVNLKWICAISVLKNNYGKISVDIYFTVGCSGLPITSSEPLNVKWNSIKSDWIRDHNRKIFPDGLMMLDGSYSFLDEDRDYAYEKYHDLTGSVYEDRSKKEYEDFVSAYKIYHNETPA